MLSFNEKCYESIKQIPKGKVTTYLNIAKKLNSKAYRAVGNAMNKNPYGTEKYPCHKVVKSNGEIGGYFKEIEIKIKKLENENIEIIKIGKDKTKWKIKNFKKINHEF